MNEQKTVIGITGRICAGKEFVADFLSDRYSAAKIPSSDALYTSLQVFGLPKTRKNAQDFSTFIRTSYGDDALEFPILRFIEHSSSRIFVTSSLRREADFARLKLYFRFFLIYVEAPQAKRYQWFAKRAKDRRDLEMSYETFQERDDVETEARIEDLKAVSDLCLQNNGTLDDVIPKLAPVIEFLEKEKSADVKDV